MALGIMGGVILLIVGLVLRGHFGHLYAFCTSSLGSAAQTLVPNAQNQCSLNSDILTLGDILAWLGGLTILSGAVGGFALLNRAQSGTGWHAVDVGESKSDPPTQRKSGWQDIELDDEA